MRQVHTDCRHYVGDKPCKPHKREGVVCGDCHHYTPVHARVLIVKLAAMGDVLRTTAILPALEDAYEGVHVTWVTAQSSEPLLRHNPYIDRILVDDAVTLAILQVERFDLGICLDLGEDAAALLAAATCDHVLGFVRNARGVVEPQGPAAEDWYAMSLWDDLKKANTATYQDWMYRVLGLPFQGQRPVLNLTDDEHAGAHARLDNLVRPLVGLNLGGGGRWKYKRWTLEGFLGLAKRLYTERGATPVLFYGPDEHNLAAEFMQRSEVPCFDARHDNPVRDFAALVGACDLLVTGDTLAMHLAVAQEIPCVVLFGPTSAAEIDLYGLGEKLVADIPCACCYLTDCDVRPTCMDKINVETVFDACTRLLTGEG